MKEFNYLSINRTPKIKLLSDDEENILTMNIITTLAATQDDSVGKEINNYFNKLISNNAEDLLQINTKQAKTYLEKYKIQKEYNNSVVNRLLQYDDNSSFNLDKGNTEQLATILAFIYKNLSSRSVAKSYKIKNFMNIVLKAELISSQKVNVINLFTSKENIKKQKDSYGSGSSPDAMSSRKISTVSKDCSLEDNSSYQYPKPNQDISGIKYELPLEMIILINKFENIKKLSMNIDDSDEKKKLEYLLIFLNLKWLFPKLQEIDFDLGCDSLQGDMDEIIKKKIANGRND